MRCNQCEMVSINGIGCHETGCSNAKKEWSGEEWVSVHSCPECGSTYNESEHAAECCAWESDDRLSGHRLRCPGCGLPTIEDRPGVTEDDALCSVCAD